MPRIVPKADARIGKKIDFLAAGLGDILQPHGFVRKARRVWRVAGEGEQACFHVIDLQGDKWNEGSWGKLRINFGVQYPGLIRGLAEMLEQPWRVDIADVADTASCCPQGRLAAVLPAQPEPWWTPEMAAGGDIWFAIDAATDLAALAAVLEAAATHYLLPWFEREAGLESMFRRPGPGAEAYCLGLVGGVMLGQRQAVAAAFREQGSRRLGAGWFAQARGWLQRNGVDCAGVEYVPEPPGSEESSRAEKFEKHRQRAEALERLLAQDPAPAGERLPQLLDAYHEACRTRAGPHSASPIWSLLRMANVATRRLAVLTIMRQLVGAATDVPSLHPNVWGKYASYDGYWGEMLPMLLDGLPCDEAFASALLAALAPLTQRLSRPGIVSLEITDSFRHAISYLEREAQPWRAALAPAAAQLLDTLRALALADFDEAARAVLALSEQDGLGSVHPDQAVRARLAQFPEQRFVQPDREAIATLRSWLE